MIQERDGVFTKNASVECKDRNGCAAISLNFFGLVNQNIRIMYIM